MPTRWTDKEIDLLKQMTADGASTDEISEKLGRSPSAIKTKLKSIKVEPAPKKVGSEEEMVTTTSAEEGGTSSHAERVKQPASQDSKNQTSMVPYIIAIIVLAAIVITLID